MKNLLLALSVVFVTAAANAGGFIEPYIGIMKGTLKQGGGAPDLDTKGNSLGLRAGYQMVIPWVALDVKMTKGTLDSSPEADISYTDVGVTVGASVPFVRPYIGYIPKAKTKVEVSGGASGDYEGTGLKLGLGIKILPLVDINIEKVDYTFKEYDGADLPEDEKHETLTFGLGITF
ncbi:outer membrane beta-barrel protein [Pseudobdellovibrio sp. HCB154]|uniref:outer membrane beta-barrel protein n=1 Tax=Pseudobdellovibrio sp. HCB154 TaxID=3386277 RepID=UPI003916F39E